MPKIAEGVGPATLPGFALNSFHEFTFIITLTPRSLANQDLFFQRPLVIPRNRIGVHFPYMGQIHWMFGNPYVDVTVNFDPAWLNKQAEWRFTASVVSGELNIYRNREKIGMWNLGVSPNTPYEADMFIGMEPVGLESNTFQGEIGKWSIHDTFQAPNSVWPWVIGAGVAVGLIAVAKKGKLSFA